MLMQYFINMFVCLFSSGHQQPPLTFDYVLVAKISEDENNHIFRKQTAFIDNLKKKKFNVYVSAFSIFEFLV